jgi:hypothetical protein
MMGPGVGPSEAALAAWLRRINDWLYVADGRAEFALWAAGRRAVIGNAP